MYEKINNSTTYLIFSGNVISQATNYTVSYDGVPACNTTFTISDTNKRVLGTGKSDESGTFACDHDVERTGVFLLKASPDKGKGWELRIPFEALETSGMGYDIVLENVEAMMNEAFEMQNDLIGGAREQNEEMNRETGSSEGTQELELIGGIVKAGQKIGDAQFKVIRLSIGKSCSDAASTTLKKNDKALKVDEKHNSTDGKHQAKPDSESGENARVKTEKTEAVKVQESSEKPEASISKKEQKEKEELEAQQARDAEKEAARLEKERKEKERLEKERIAAEEEAAAEDLNFTPEEFAQMSIIDLNKKQVWCEAAIGRNTLKLKTRSALMKPEEKAAIESRVKELEAAVNAIKMELDRREAAGKANKENKEGGQK